MRARYFGWLLASVLGLAGSNGFAQGDVKPYAECTREPTEGDVGAAKGAFQAGQASFNEADYGRAIFYWEDAFRRDCTATALLLNLARGYELAGNKRQAVVALETYLARQTDTPQRDQITRRIEVLNRQLDQEGPPAKPAETSTEAPAGEDPLPPREAPDEPVQEPVDTPSGKRSFVPLIVAGAGVGIAAVGLLVIYSPANSDLKPYVEEVEGVPGSPFCENRMCQTTVVEGRTIEGEVLSQEANALRSRKQVGGYIGIAGLVVAGAGVIWYFVQPTSRPVASLRLSPVAAVDVVPVVGPRQTGFSLSGHF
ncbi:MAG TPA: hypothetical protein VF989_08350 [Polyangiaceae bacterium]